MTDAVKVPLQSLLIKVSERIGDAHTLDAQDWIQHGEWGLAIEVIADGLFNSGAKLDADERRTFVSLVQSIRRPISDFDFLNLTV